MRTYYFHHGDDIVGPISLGDLRKFVSIGSVKADTLVGNAPQGKWLPASTLPELRDDGATESHTRDESAPNRTVPAGEKAKSKSFYFRHPDGRVVGPLTGRELRNAAAVGDVRPETLVSMNPAKPWVSATRVKGLFDESGRAVSCNEYEAAKSAERVELGAATSRDSAISPGRSGPVAIPAIRPQDIVDADVVNMPTAGEWAASPPPDESRANLETPPVEKTKAMESFNRPENLPPPETAHREATAQLCSICQTLLQASDPSTTCSECHLPFHEECWEENLGCSAYGCPNVNALRPGPDIQINSPPPLPSRYQSVNNNVQTEESDIPWEYLLLAASALGALLGLVCFGVFSLAAGIVAVIYFIATEKEKPSAVLAACLAMSLIGFIVGVALSVSFWELLSDVVF